MVVDLLFGMFKWVELGWVLVSWLKLLLFDEFVGGFNYEEVGSLMELLCSICEWFLMSLLLVEYYMNLVMCIFD